MFLALILILPINLDFQHLTKKTIDYGKDKVSCVKQITEIKLIDSQIGINLFISCMNTHGWYLKGVSK